MSHGCSLVGSIVAHSGTDAAKATRTTMVEKAEMQSVGIIPKSLITLEPPVMMAPTEIVRALCE